MAETWQSLLWRPWYDAVSLPLLVKYFFPLSRAWAAAVAARGDGHAFAAALGRPAAAGRSRALGLVEAARRDWQAAEDDWRQLLFAPEAVEAETLAAAERARGRAAFRLMATRGAFLPAHLRRPFPPVRFAVEPSATILAAQAPRLAAPETAFALGDDDPAVAASHAIAREGGGRRTWLRYPGAGPCADTDAWARVDEPAGAPAPATVVFAHGIAMEDEFWGEEFGGAARLVSAGLRLVSPEGPWHGRRRADGAYGGEPVFGRGPAGLVDYFAAHVAEIGRLIAWARGRFGGPVGVAGISLGALTGQMVLTAARGWPDGARPDAALLVSPSNSIEATVFAGGLTDGLGVGRAIAEAGWRSEHVRALLALLEPQGAPALAPERILIVLGEHDRIVPFATGLGRAEDWGVPAANRYIRPQGHFSVSLGLTAQPEPIDRLAALLKGR